MLSIRFRLAIASLLLASGMTCTAQDVALTAIGVSPQLPWVQGSGSAIQFTVRNNGIDAVRVGFDIEGIDKNDGLIAFADPCSDPAFDTSACLDFGLSLPGLCEGADMVCAQSPRPASDLLFCRTTQPLAAGASASCEITLLGAINAVGAKTGTFRVWPRPIDPEDPTILVDSNPANNSLPLQVAYAAPAQPQIPVPVLGRIGLALLITLMILATRPIGRH